MSSDPGSSFNAKNSLSHELVAVSCCICGSSDGDTIAQGRDFEYETTADLFTVQRCRGCGHVFLSPRPSAADLAVIYPPEYYAYGFLDDMNPLVRRIKEKMDASKIDAWLRESPTASPRFLDVGCGEGWFLRLLRARGIDPRKLWGVELDAEVVQRLTRDGFQARCGAIENIDDLEERSFDLIVSLQVIEHVADPGAVLRRLADLLAPGGAIILETPNINSVDCRVFRRSYWGGYHFPRHWNFFSPETMAALVSPLGLRIDRVRYIPAPTFWLYSLHHVLKYEWGWPRMARLADPFRNLPLMGAATVFDRVRAALGFRTSNMQLVLRRSSDDERSSQRDKKTQTADELR